MNERLRWALDWACVGAATSALAPLPAWWTTAQVPDDYLILSGVLGAGSGLVIGVLLSLLYGAIPERSRVATLSVLAPLPLGTWGALVAAAAAVRTAPEMTVLAFFLGSFSAVLQMLWFVPVYTSAVRRGWQLVPMLLSVPLAPVAGALGVIGFFFLGDVVRGL